MKSHVAQVAEGPPNAFFPVSPRYLKMPVAPQLPLLERAEDVVPVDLQVALHAADKVRSIQPFFN
jgi:hypothetical protein